MLINYKLALFVYSPIMLLLIIITLKDKFEPRSDFFKLCNWSLWPTIAILFILLSVEEVKSLWRARLLPSLNQYPYNPSSLEIFNTLFYCLLLLFVYALFKQIYKVRILDVFDINLKHMPLALYACGIFALIKILSIYLLDLNFNPQEHVQDFIRTMDRPHLAFFSFSAIVVAPLLEETIFRGLIYAPLYRKVGRCFAIVLSSFFWTHVHFEPLLTSIGTFMIGIILGWLYDKSGSLVAPIVFHSFNNSWIVFYLYTAH